MPLLTHCVAGVSDYGRGDPGVVLGLLPPDEVYRSIHHLLDFARFEVDNSLAQDGPELCPPEDLSRHIRDEVHVVDQGGARLEHLVGRQLGAVLDEVWRAELALGRPDELVQPHLQLLVVAVPPQHRHPGVCVAVDQTRDERMSVGVVDNPPGRVCLAHIVVGHDGGDPLALDAHSVPLQHPRGVAVHRDHPSCQDGRVMICAF
mmetsp:Transcript_11173/g.27045  ORF Transcript_11173/g.27045 Transcript_11173/m.27045 type:complete len:204 (-) Transcript_11173:86-697(-)